MTLLSSPLDDETIKNHLKINREVWLEYMSGQNEEKKKEKYKEKSFFVDGYIGAQKWLDDMYYGVNGGPIMAKENACEIIALYNALYSLNDGVEKSKYDFPELIAQMEGLGPCINGIWGTSPFIIMYYLQNEGYKVKLYEGKKAQKESNLQDLEREYDTYIVTVYNDKNDVGEMVHTMCITKTNIDGEIKYNLRNGSVDEPKDSISECLDAYADGNSQTISIMGVNK